MADVIHISIGSEPMQEMACEVLKSSILRRTSRPVVFSSSWSRMGDWHPAMMEAPKLKPGTKFSGWRWLVPKLYANRGRAIYLDADQVVLADIAELWDSLQPGKAFAAVTDAQGFFGHKQPEPGAVQTSVMVMDCAVCDWNPHALFKDVASGKLRYRDLMQARFLARESIQDLDPAWNHFGEHRPNTKLLHWSHVNSQPYRKTSDPISGGDHPTAHIFKQELHAAIRAGHITRAAVYEACAAGGLCMVWGNKLPAEPTPAELTPRATTSGPTMPGLQPPPGVPADATLGFRPDHSG